MSISIKTKKEIEIMREGGRILAAIMKQLEQMVRPGITTKELDRAAEALVLKYGAASAFKGYEGFPAVLCTSVNSVVVHGLPSDYKLKEGDILSLDIGIEYKGFFTDMAVTLPITEISRGRTPVNFDPKTSRGPTPGSFSPTPKSFNPEALRLIRVTKKALKLGIKKARPGNTFGDIGNTIQRYVESRGFNVVRELCGHGIGRELHEEPKVPNYGRRHKGETIKEGMVFCIEPMVAMGDWHLKKSEDSFGYETKDNSLSCHFEHTVAVAENDPGVLTKI